MELKPWAIFITWPHIVAPVQSGEYASRTEAEARKRWLEGKVTGYSKMEVVWTAEEYQPPHCLRNPSEHRRGRRQFSTVEQWRLER